MKFRVQVNHARPQAMAWMALGATLFACMNFFARVSATHAHWTVVAATRAAVGAVIALAIARMRRVSVLIPPTRAMWMRSLFGTAAMACSFFAFTSPYIALADAVTLTNTTPLFIGALSPFFLNERTGKRVVFALLVSMLGAVLVIRPPLLFGSMVDVANRGLDTGMGHAGELLVGAVALVSAVLSAFAMMFLRRASPNENAEAIAFHFSLVACFALAVFACAISRQFDLRALPAMLAAGACAGCAQVAMTRAYALESAARVSGIGYLQVVVAACLGTLVLHEPLRTTALMGMVLVLVGGAMVTATGIWES